MLKRVLNIVIIISLLISTTGLLISKHYCHGHLVSIAYGHDAESCCTSCNSCQNETKFYQVKDDFIPTIIIDNVSFYETLIVLESFFNTELFKIDFESHSEIFSGSPPIYNLHTFLSVIQNFRL